MANDSGEEKTEQPSSKKLRDAHKKGQVAKSTEFSGGLALMVGLLLTMAMVPWFVRQLAGLFLAVERSIVRPDPIAAQALIYEGLKLTGLVSMVPLLSVAVVFTASMWLQTGSVFSLDPVQPKLERLDPVEGLKKLFSMKSLVQFILLLLKTAVIGSAVALVCLKVLPDAIRVIHAGLGAALEVARSALVQLLSWCSGLFVLLGAADLGFQRWQFTKEMRMSKSELKREHRDQEGDGHIKAERRRAGNEPPREEQLKYMHMASLVLKHHDGRLVVLIYRTALHELPLYLLRASGDFAGAVLALAAKQQVRQVLDDVLTAKLYSGTQMGVPIQRVDVAEVMAHLGAQALGAAG